MCWIFTTLRRSSWFFCVRSHISSDVLVSDVWSRRMTDVHKQSLFSIYQWSIVTTPTHAIFFILFGLLWLDNIVFAAIRLDFPLHKIDFNAHCFTLSVFGFMFSEIFSKKFNCQTFNSCRGSLGVINHIFPQSRK